MNAPSCSSLRWVRNLACAAVLTSTCVAANRDVRPLPTSWRFIKEDVSLSASSGAWETVSVPHTYNAVDGQNGKDAEPQFAEGYYRGPAWYEHDLSELKGAQGRRVYARFEAAALVAEVYVNDVKVGGHRGGFAAFAVELTEALRFDGTDRLRVRVDNARQADLAPLSGDFTIFGGLYRPVSLILTDPVHVSLKDHGSFGFYLKAGPLTDEKGVVLPVVVVANGTTKETSQTVSVELLDASGAVVAKEKETVVLKPGENTVRLGAIEVAKPHRWDGQNDPYLYQATVSLDSGDTVKQPLGFRTTAFAPDGTYLLNGKPYPMHGVNRHQERKDKGWAVARQDHEEDIALIMELGATCLRLAHYQQADQVHDLCDRSGLIVWQETPLVDTVGKDPGFTQTSLQQQEEMIYQGYNHPSLCQWGLFNELDAAWAAVPSGPSVPVIQALARHAHEIDPSRPTVSASWIRDGSPLHPIPEQIAFNIYPGWYWGVPDDFGPTVDTLFNEMHRKVGISEYGAGANPWHHGETATTPPSKDGAFHPEEWQTHLHERSWLSAKGNPKIWGTYVWAMFDFAIDKRNEGGVPGQNDKGLVTRDRKTRKDAFYFYQANWSRKPMVHLASQRNKERKNAVTDVEVFTNQGTAELFVNGKSLGIQRVDAINVCRWPGVALSAGENHIEVRAGILADSCTWTLVK